MSKPAGSFCGSNFWDWNLSWNTDFPDLTPCFEHTVLIWIASIVLFLSVLLNIFSWLNSSAKSSKPTLNSSVVEIVGSFILIALDIANFSIGFIYNGIEDDIDSQAERVGLTLRVINYVVIITLTVVHYAKGIQTYGGRTLFWIVSVLCDSILFQSILRKPGTWNAHDCLELTHYCVAVIATVGHLCIRDDGLSNSVDNITQNVNTNPEADASLLSRMIFAWPTRFLWLGYKKTLEMSDLWELDSKNTSRNLYARFERQWNAERDKINENPVSSKVKTVSVPLTLARTFWTPLSVSGLYKILTVLLFFVTPQVLRYLISFVSTKDNSSAHAWNGFFFVFLLLGTVTIQTLLQQQFYHLVFPLGMNARSALICAVHRKALKLSSIAKKELQSTVGDISNLMSIDVHNVMDFIFVIHLYWGSLLQVVLAFYFLWGVLGPSSLAGLAVMFLLIPMNAFVSSITRKIQSRQMKSKDKRVKLMTEIISGIKSIKLHAWESFFDNNVKEIRSKEIPELKKSAYLQSISLSLCSCSLVLASAVSFITYVLIDDKNVLTPEVAFVSFTLLNTLQQPMDILPIMMTRLINACIAFKRLNKFMNAEEIQKIETGDESLSTDPVVIENGCFGWEEKKECLRNINLRIHAGELIAVVGAVGCGKTTLLSAILGETVTVQGSLTRQGTLSYVAQQAWIQNLSLRENILFGDKLDEDRYSKVIEACALQTDLQSLPAADLTEIGEKGVNLSGGQKQRVSLARAAYSSSDLYLLDDPLSAVDAHVGRHIFDRVIGPKGMLKNKTRIMVTHGINFLSQVDRIVVMKGGEVCELGTYSDLLAQRGAFADFILQNAKDSFTEKEQERTCELSENSESNPELHRRQSQINRRENLDCVEDCEIEGKLVDAEKMESGCVKKGVYWYYFQAVGYPLGVAALITNVMFQGIQMASQLWLRKWSNQSNAKLIGEQPVDGQQNMFMAVYGALGVTQSLVYMVGTGSTLIGMLRASRVMHDSMLARILRAPMTFFDTTPLGRIVNRFAFDVDILDNSLPNSLRSWIQCLFSVVTTVIIISLSTPLFLAAMVPLAFLYFFLQSVYLNNSRQLKRLESVKRSPIYSHFSELLNGCTTIRAYAKEDMFSRHCEKIVDAYTRCFYPGIVANRWLGVGIESLSNFVVFFAGFFAVWGRDSLDAGSVGLSISCAIQITQAFSWLARVAAEVETSSVSIERVKEFTEISQEATLETSEDKRIESNWPNKGRITFDSYESRYREGLGLVLKKISFTVESNEKVGVVGRTGAGKTSLTNALFRIVEASGGRICIDFKNIAEIGLHDIRSRISIIPQDPMLFSGTLRQNLDPFERYLDSQIWKVLELVHLKRFVICCVEGLSYKISDGGSNFSAGQRQLLCLARALLQHSKILIMDEATSCIDLETDNLIQETIKEEFKDSTVLIVAHRLNTVMDCTRILVLDNGHVIEFDTPANLLSDKQSAFYKMAKDAGYL